MSEATIPDRPSGPFPCDECQAGMMRLQFITYFTWLTDELIMVPNFPAWICDVCGRRDYDERSIAWLTMLLNPDAGKSPNARRSVRRRDRPATPGASPQS